MCVGHLLNTAIEHANVLSRGRPPTARFRTFQVCPKDLRTTRCQAERAEVPCVLGQVTCDPGESTMSDQAVEKRRNLASEIVWVVLYSVLIFLVMLLWVDVPA